MGGCSSRVMQDQRNRVLLDSFDEMLEHIHDMTKHEDASVGFTHMPSSPAQKPSLPTLPAVSTCLPIGAAFLKLDVTHRKRVLRGTVAVADLIFTKGVTLLIRDENGDMVRLGIYNIIPDGTLACRLAAARRMFPLGRHVAILEPFYKTWVDGGNGVRIDNPSEVTFPDTLGPTDVAGLHEEGNALFRAGHTADAALAYGRALQLHLSSGPAKGLMTSVLLNASTCLVALDRHDHALVCSTTMLALDPSCAKAFMQAALALDAMGQHQCAGWFMREAVSRSNLDPDSPQAREMTGTLSPAAAATDNANWLFDVLPVVTSEVIEAVNVFTGPLFMDSTIKGCTGTPEKIAVDEAAVAAVFKKLGDDLLAAKKFFEAMKHYEGALASLRQYRRKANVLLANRASCSLRLGMEGVQAVMEDSCAAIVLDFTQPKSFHRVACVLMELGTTQLALDFVNAGLGQAPGHVELTALGKRLAGQLASAPSQ